MFKFDPNRLKSNTEPLGQGDSAAVFPYPKTDNDTRWVVKCIYAQNFNRLMQVLQEVVIGYNLDHPALLANRGFHAEKNSPGYNIYVKMPRMQMTMVELIAERQRTGKSMSETRILHYFDTLINGLEYLHSRKIAHRDIRPTNILLDDTKEVKLADVSIAAFAEDKEQHHNETKTYRLEAYRAPEMLEQNAKHKKKDLYSADLWSLGLVLLEMCLLEPGILKAKLSVEEREQLVKKKLEQAAKGYSDKLVALLTTLLDSKPSQRRTATGIRITLEQISGDIQKVSTYLLRWRAVLIIQTRLTKNS